MQIDVNFARPTLKMFVYGENDEKFLHMAYNADSALHVLSATSSDKEQMTVWKFDLPGFSSDADLISMITLNFAEDNRSVQSSGNLISVSSTSSGGDLISACAIVT